MAASLERPISIETKEILIWVAIMNVVYDNHARGFSAEAVLNSVGWRGRHVTSAEGVRVICKGARSMLSWRF